MDHIQRLRRDYPWVQSPLVVGAPMRLIALADMAVEISKAGGIGFIGAGTDVSGLASQLQSAQERLTDASVKTSNGTLPIGIGFINWGADLAASIAMIRQYRPAAVWFFAPASVSSLVEWAQKSRQASPETKIWVQIGSVKEALDTVTSIRPDVLVVQGTDAGGHGLVQGASLLPLLPEVCDAVEQLVSRLADADADQAAKYAGPVFLAAGGIAEARSAAAAFLLGAAGIVLGTRLLASPEANVSRGYQAEVLRAADGGQTTVRTKVYDMLRGTIWAATHNARGLVNESYADAVAGMGEDENRALYQVEMEKGDSGWGAHGRMTTYAGTAVGLVREIKGVGEVVREIREGVVVLLERARATV